MISLPATCNQSACKKAGKMSFKRLWTLLHTMLASTFCSSITEHAPEQQATVLCINHFASELQSIPDGYLTMSSQSWPKDCKKKVFLLPTCQTHVNGRTISLKGAGSRSYLLRQSGRKKDMRKNHIHCAVCQPQSCLPVYYQSRIKLMSSCCALKSAWWVASALSLLLVLRC